MYKVFKIFEIGVGIWYSIILRICWLKIEILVELYVKKRYFVYSVFEFFKIIDVCDF